MFTLFFKNLGKNDASIAGGKWASLGEMTRAGIPVPPGFVVLSGTFDRFIQESGLASEITSILSTVDNKQTHSVEGASEKIQALIRNAHFPLNIATEIKEQFRVLGAEYVAVRSSATAEDGADHAWAGQLDSYLNTTEANLLEKIQSCWASLFTPRAIFYRFEKGLHATQISVAVVVQKMVESEVSGIAFSVHPVTEDRNQIIIEAGYGLGEAIVSGQITPDSYVVGKNPRKILDTNIAVQTHGIFRASTGGDEWRNIDTEKSSRQKLTDEQILELSTMILRIEEHYGFPCDIEWAYEGGGFFIVQSRPITTLTKENESKISTQKSWKKLWSRDYGIQFFYAPVFGFGIYPIDEEFAINEVVVLPEKGMQSIFVKEEGFDLLMDSIQSKYIENPDNLKKFIDEFKENGEDLVQKSSEYIKCVDRTSDEALLIRLSSFNKDFKSYGSYLWLTFLVNELMGKYITSTIDSMSFTEKEKSALLEYAITPSTPSGVFLLEVEAKKFPLTSLVQNFSWLTTLDIHNEPATENDINTRISDTPNKDTLIPERFNDISIEKQEMIMLSRETTYIKDLRDDFRRKAICNILPLFDEITRRTGVDRKNLSYLSIDEIFSLFKKNTDKEMIVQETNNRINNGFMLYKTHEWFLVESDQEKIKKFSHENNLPILTTQVLSSQEITWIIGQKGKLQGKVVVVHSIKEIEKVLKWSILCTVTTNPDYIPAMQKSAAFITDEGGITCHAAIIAREMNKPCIIGTKFATQVLRDGDVVEVDADNGVVRILEKAT